MNNMANVARGVVDGAFAADYQALKPQRTPNWASATGIALALMSALYEGFILGTLPDLAAWFCTFWFGIALACSVTVTPRVFALGYLISMLAYLLAWRIAALHSAQTVMVIASLGAIPLALQFVDCCLHDLRESRGRPGAWLGAVLWQFTLIRMTFGLNELCHSAEKLFAGQEAFEHMVHAFQALGIAQGAALFVILGGLIELASAVSVGLGLFARVGGFVSLIYMVVATVGFGGEWARGYAWASSGGGGWEYVLLLLVVFSSVSAVGAGKFSIDGWMLSKGLVRRLRFFCTNHVA
ncbi:DoxX family protein [Pseudomonas sp. NPDC089752]|uniref:DoxX family protein n=1 Tax=Pseudomonas sp. NPDC089752 TaxID=3364472 RepID=UPI00380008C7